jgi:hypothetical protein
MKRIAIALTGVALGLVFLAGPAAADYPPTTPPATTTSPPTTTAPPATTTSPPTTPATTTMSPSVKGSETESESPSDEVLGKTVTVSPGVGGTAFTGSDLIRPLALGGILLLVGLSLLYRTRRRAAADDK